MMLNNSKRRATAKTGSPAAAGNRRETTTVRGPTTAGTTRNTGNTSSRRDLNSCREGSNIEALAIAETPGTKQQR